MKVNIDCHNRFGLIDDIRFELIHGEEARPLEIILYILVKDSNIIIDNFDHRKLRGGEGFIADRVRKTYGYRPIILPEGFMYYSYPIVRCRNLIFQTMDHIYGNTQTTPPDLFPTHTPQEPNRLNRRNDNYNHGRGLCQDVFLL